MDMKFIQNTRHHAQAGSALVIALLLLIVMTLLGLTSMRSSTLEERMAGNAQDINLSFQAAEAGLRDAEAFIETIVSPAAFNGTNGLLGESDDEPDFFNASTWTGSNSRVYTGTALSSVDQQPRYIIKYLGDVTNTSAANLAGNIRGYGQQANSLTVSIFRVTVKGTGQNPNTTTVLQGQYGRIF